MKYRNGSPYVPVIRLVIDGARCLLEMCSRWDGPEKRVLPVDGLDGLNCNRNRNTETGTGACSSCPFSGLSTPRISVVMGGQVTERMMQSNPVEFKMCNLVAGPYLKQVVAATVTTISGRHGQDGERALPSCN